MMQRATLAAVGFAVCVVVGASMSVLIGLESRIWIPAGVTCSAVVAAFAFQSARERDRMGCSARRP